MCSPVVSPESSVVAGVDNANTTNGSSVTFACSADGGPDNVFVWIMVADSVDLGSISLSPPLNLSEVVELLQSTYSVLQQSSDDEHVIDSVNATENGGTYACVVVNVAGFDSDEVELLVQPTITRQPLSVLTFVGENISLSCEADSFPPPSYSWFRQTEEGVVVIVNEDPPRLTLNNSSRDLFFYGVEYSDAGFYFCRASSSSGNADSRSATITGAHKHSLNDYPPVLEYACMYSAAQTQLNKRVRTSRVTNKITHEDVTKTRDVTVRIGIPGTCEYLYKFHITCIKLY